MSSCGLPLPETVETVRLSVVQCGPSCTRPECIRCRSLDTADLLPSAENEGDVRRIPGWVRAPNGRRRTSQSPEHTDLGSGLHAFNGRIVPVNNRLPAASEPTNLGYDLLEEVRKSLKRLKVLEGLKADRDPILTPITT